MEISNQTLIMIGIIILFIIIIFRNQNTENNVVITSSSTQSHSHDFSKYPLDFVKCQNGSCSRQNDDISSWITINFDEKNNKIETKIIKKEINERETIECPSNGLCYGLYNIKTSE